MKNVTGVFLLSFLLINCSNVKKSGLNSSYDVEVVEATGMAPLTSDIKAAKESSLSDALKNALHLVVGVYISGESMVSKSILIDDEITSKTEGYIEKYEVIKEYTEDNFYKVKIKAYVRKEDIANKLKKIENEVEKIGSPVVYISLTDVDKTDISFANSGLLSELRKDSFRVVNDLDTADIIVDGKTVSKFNTSEGLGGFYSYSCSISGNIKTKYGEMVGGFNASNGGIGVNETDARNNAILNCIRKVYPDIKNSIITFYTEKKTIKLEVSNISTINMVQEIVKYLRNIPAVKTSFVKSYDKDTAVFEIVMHKGKANDIAVLLSKKGDIEVSSTGEFLIKARIK